MMYLHICHLCKKMWRDIEPISKCPVCGKLCGRTDKEN